LERRSEVTERHAEVDEAAGARRAGVVRWVGNEIEQRFSDPQRDERTLSTAARLEAFDREAEEPLIETQRTIEVTNAEHEVVEGANANHGSIQ
jgi:hypothetical protein